MVQAKRLLKRAIHAMGYDLIKTGSTNILGNYLLGLYLRELLTHLKINCVFDVGGHYGEYGKFLRENGYKGHIISIEPVSANYSRLQETAAEDASWKVYNHALGSKAGKLDINVAQISMLSSFLPPSSFGQTEYGQDIKIEQTETVQVLRLDEIFDEYIAHIQNPRIYLKMDTQGWDLEVIKGAAGCIDRILALQSEVAVQPLYKNVPSYFESISQYTSMGFDLANLFPVWLDHDFKAIEFDCIMVRATSDKTVNN